MEKLLKVLILEDEALIALSMQEVLSLVGVEVVGVAATVGEALRLAGSTNPDVAICDVRLAGRRDGIDGAVLLHESSGLPVIFVTGQDDSATRQRAAKVDPVAYLEKPVRPQELIAAVQSAIAGHRAKA
jgi:two-component system, response regulator PdtaR